MFGKGASGKAHSAGDKGKGKSGKDPKGKAAQFQGQCFACGKFGHRASVCPG